MSSPRCLRGSTKVCPKCASSKVGYDPLLRLNGYGPGLACCMNCKTLWEPFEPEQIWDTRDPVCSFKEPCNNCAFRPGSPEQSDLVKWRALVDKLKCGGSFYCHKGVPIESEAEHGFAYPSKTITVVVNGQALARQASDPKKLRLCRGYLNALRGLHRAFEKESKSGKLDVLSIVGDSEL